MGECKNEGKERIGEVEAKVEAEVDLYALLQQSIKVPPQTLPPEVEAEAEAGGWGKYFICN